MSQHPLRRYGAVLGLCMLVGGLAGGVAGFVGGLTNESGPVFGLTVVVTIAAGVAGGLWATLKWWRGLDEAAQEAHKSAWFWGSTFSLALVGIALGFVLVVDDPGPFVGADPRDAFAAGIVVVVGLQTLSYGVAWAVWWLRRR